MAEIQKKTDAADVAILEEPPAVNDAGTAPAVPATDRPTPASSGQEWSSPPQTTSDRTSH